MAGSLTPSSNRLGAVILAAGASSRLGFPKQTVRFEGETLLDRTIRLAREAGADVVVVVLGAFEGEVRSACQLAGTTLVSNPDWAKGMGTSIRRGIQALPDSKGCLVLTCDMPAVTSSHLRLLAERGTLTASLYCSKRGVPAYFPSQAFPGLLQLDDAIGASALLTSAAALPLTGGEFDVDTPQDVRALLEKDQLG
jgi:molybdenum cofactor cytidylyltransferase